MCAFEQITVEQSGMLDSGHGHWGLCNDCNDKESTMNKNQINGKLQDIGGKIQEEAGKLVGNPDQQVKGLQNQVEGKTQEKLGDVQEKLKDSLN